MLRRDLVAEPRWPSYLAKLYGRDATALLRTQVDLIYRPRELGITLKPVPTNHRLGHCPRNISVAYADFNVHAPLQDGRRDFVAWYTRRRFARSEALKNNTWAEVTHCGGSRFERDGAWHYVVKGSGIWLNTGRTIVFSTHDHASRYFLGARCSGWSFQCDHTMGNFTRAARAQGFDSVQFLQHCDGRCHGQCGHELLMTRAMGTSACSTGLEYRGGWSASEPCECVEWLKSRRGGACAACSNFVSRLRSEPHAQETAIMGAAHAPSSRTLEALEAGTTGNTSAADQWAGVCAIERARAQRWKSWVVDDASVSPPRSLNASLEHLEKLLHTRGTLCSPAQPCTVERLSEDPAAARFRVCLGALPPQRTGMFCEPGFNVASGQFVLKKACLRGAVGRCFSFDAAAITEWAMALRQEASRARSSDEKAGRKPTVRALGRCAVVASGHSLRCGASWASAIDNRSLYDAVFRANVYPRTARDAAIGGARTDFAAEPNYDRCRSHKPADAVCLPGPKSRGHPLNREHPGQPFSESTPLRRRTGLGLGHTGGVMVDQAIAFCSGGVDVFGMGLFSEGPGADLLYQHWYDERFAPACAPLQCSTSQAMTNKRDLAFFHAYGHMLCRPHAVCSNSYAVRMPYRSEHHDDFFYLSELRLHVLDALGWIRWVWF